MEAFEPTPGNLAFFAVNAEDVERACRFYQSVFGWTYRAFGPPGFYLVEGATPANQRAAIQGVPRTRPGGGQIGGFEPSIAVADIDATIKAVESAGGEIVMPKCTLVGIGYLAYLRDTEGNLVGAMQYDAKAE